MKSRINGSVAAFFAGLVLAGIAVFAEALGLDRNPGGWGRARIAIFVLGCLIVASAVIFYWFKDKFEQKFRLFGRTNPVISRIYVNRSVLQTLGFVRKYSFTFPIAAGILIVYVWLVSSGTWTQWDSPTRYYASLAQGFEYGNLYFTTKPDPRLVALENPYDPVNWRGKIQVPMDISYYQGRYYLYWGPTPAFILYLLRPFYYGRIGDLQLAFVFIYGIFLAQFLFIIAVWDRFFSDLPAWTLQMPLLLAGLACPFTFMLGVFKGARIYEAAISGGQFFLLSGFLVALTALNKSIYSSSWRLLLAGILWAFACGSRLTLIPSIAFLVVMVAYWFFKSDLAPSAILAKLFFLCMPLGVGLAALGWYNWVRFGSVTESGLYYQLTAGMYLQKYYKDLVDPIYLLQNLYNYVFYPFEVGSQFPFFTPQYAYGTAIFGFYDLPKLYSGQWTTGFLWTLPFSLFAVIPLAKLIAGLFRSGSDQGLPGDDVRLFKWIIQALCGSCIAAFGFLLLFFWAAMRYMTDFMPFLIFLSVMGFWQGYRFFSERPVQHRYYVALGIAAAGISMVSSTLLALSVNDARFVLMQLIPFFQ